MPRKQASKFLESSDLQDRLTNLYYESDNSWKLLPKWATFFLELGLSISNYDRSNGHLVLGISVPTRSYVSSLVTTGIILGRIGKPTNLGEQIARIEQLPKGKPVILRSGSNFLYKGFYNGVRETSRGKLFVIKTDKTTERFVSYDKACQIEVIEDYSIKLRESQRGRLISKEDPLLDEILSPSERTKLITESRTECILFCQKNIFTEEIKNTQIAYEIDGVFRKGAFQDFIRPRGVRTYQTYRSLIIPANGRVNRRIISKTSPFAIVFDSSLSFVKWRSSCKDCSWIVIFDRTDRNFEYGIYEFNSEYKMNRNERKLNLYLPKPPDGVELMVFEVPG